jgi:hypothetical protein
MAMARPSSLPVIWSVELPNGQRLDMVRDDVFRAGIDAANAPSPLSPLAIKPTGTFIPKAESDRQ